MEQLNLVHEDIYDALRTCVQALGGAKKVGSMLWPELSADKAGNRLNDALNTSKRDVLNPEQVLLILHESRKASCHVAMYFITDECEYERPRPIEPESEFARLQREHIEAIKTIKTMTERMEQMLALREVSNG